MANAHGYVTLLKIGGVYVSGCNNTNGVWLQGHVKQLLAHSGTVACTIYSNVIECNKFYHTSECRHSVTMFEAERTWQEL